MPEQAIAAPAGDAASFTEFKEVWLDEVRKDSPSTTELGHRFARKLLCQWLDVKSHPNFPLSSHRKFPPPGVM
jgi:hypothetical protein